jgi:hypothetical protein
MFGQSKLMLQTAPPLWVTLAESVIRPTPAVGKLMVMAGPVESGGVWFRPQKQVYKVGYDTGPAGPKASPFEHPLMAIKEAMPPLKDEIVVSVPAGPCGP